MAVSLLDGEGCPDCGSDLTAYATLQDALFAHGGYGATNRTVQLVCGECGWSMVREVTETRPPKPVHNLEAGPVYNLETGSK